MTEPQTRTVRWFPVWALAVGASGKAARLTAANRQLRHDLAVAEAATVRATEERDRARRLVDALTDECLACDDRMASMRTQLSVVLDVRAGFVTEDAEGATGAWLLGEAGPA